MMGTVINRNPNIPRVMGFVNIISGMWIIVLNIFNIVKKIMQFIDVDTHVFIEDVYKDLLEPYKSLAPQFVWKTYSKKPKFWDNIWGKETPRDSLEFTLKHYNWQGQKFLCDENGYHDMDIFPGGVYKNLQAIKDGKGPFRGDLNYSWEGARNLNERKKNLNALGIDKNIINPFNYMMGLSYRIDIELSKALNQNWNNKIQKICLNEDRFWPLISIPFQNKDINFNIKMIEDGLENGSVGITMGEHFTYADNCLGRMWGMCEWMDPFWFHANEHQYPIFFHAIDCWYDGLRWFKKSNSKVKNNWVKIHQKLMPLLTTDIWENDPENLNLTMIPKIIPHYQLSFASLIVSGVLDNYPNLRLVWAERGISWVIPTLNLLSELLNRDCSVYLKNWSFTCEPEWDNFAEDAKKIGYDHLLFASDYPHYDPSGRNRDNDISCIMSLDTDHINKEKIANINAKKLFDKTMFK
jgi:predicted TIM-barrel fold metal-dependent hydrolase